MTTSTTAPNSDRSGRAGRADRAAPPHGRLRTLTALSSLLIGAIGTWWLTSPASDPFAAGALREVMLAAIPHPGATVALTALGLTGAIVAVAGHARRRSRLVTTALLAYACLQVLGVGILAPGLKVLVLLGYLSALVGPLAGLVALAFAAWRRPWLRVVLAVVVTAIAGWGWSTGTLAPATLTTLASRLAGGFAGLGVLPLYLLLFAGSGTLWLAWAVAFRRHATGSCTTCGRRTPADGVPAWTATWGRRVTILAACGPLPYGLVRMSWLTPWPLLHPGSDAALDAAPDVRLWGLLLGTAALSGCVLTIGLLRPWGTVFPSWLPLIGGRTVPVHAAVVPAGIVATAVTMAAPSMIQLPIAEALGGDPAMLVMLVIFPFWLWGPALGVATWAYWLRRRGQCRTCGWRPATMTLP